MLKIFPTTKKGTWSSSNKTVATVSSSGTVYKESGGNCNITFKAKDGTKYTISLKVYNSKKCYLINDACASLSEGASKTYSFTMPADGKTTLYFYGYYNNYDFKTNVKYTHGNSLITVKDSKGKQVYSTKKNFSYDTAKVEFNLKKGSYKLTLKENGNYEFRYRMSVYFVTTANIKTTKISVNKTSLNLSKGSSYTLKATVAPTYATDALKWTSSNKSVATVSSNGKVTAKALGKTTVTVKSGSKSAACKVTVNKMNASVLKNKTLSLSGYVKNISDYKKGTWSSSNRSIATVNSSGTVTGKSSGSCTITFKAKDGTKYTVALKVNNWVSTKVTKISDVDIYNDCYVEFTNNTNKDITYITLNITQYDNRGYRLASPYEYYFVNDTIKAKKKYTCYFWVNDDTKSVSVRITKVWFSDGTTYAP
ncbi:MAG: Ig domain-containing protein [Acutalibacteraceae bacterium]